MMDRTIQILWQPNFFSCCCLAIDFFFLWRRQFTVNGHRAFSRNILRDVRELKCNLAKNWYNLTFFKVVTIVWVFFPPNVLASNSMKSGIYLTAKIVTNNYQQLWPVFLMTVYNMSSIVMDGLRLAFNDCCTAISLKTFITPKIF